MSRFLLVDVGAGTMDVLCYDTEQRLPYKAVAKSPVRQVAEEAAAMSGKLVVLGVEMGGGPVSRVLARRAREEEVVIGRSAAATLNHDMEKVRAMGLQVVEDQQAEALARREAYSVLTLGDIQPERLRRMVEDLGCPFSFDAVAVCAQDHGIPPPGVSHLDFRHRLFAAQLEKDPFIHRLLYRRDEIPAVLNRLQSIAAVCERLPAGEIYVMDSGMAAVLGAGMDILARDRQRVMVLDVATSHTVGAALWDHELAGFFEYHTRDVRLQRLEELLQALAEGRLEHDRILEEGGHGAFLRRVIGFENVEVFIATGPRRRLVAKSHLPIAFGAPFGDNMLTGTVGLLEALRQRLGMEAIDYI